MSARIHNKALLRKKDTPMTDGHHTGISLTACQLVGIRPCSVQISRHVVWQKALNLEFRGYMVVMRIVELR